MLVGAGFVSVIVAPDPQSRWPREIELLVLGSVTLMLFVMTGFSFLDSQAGRDSGNTTVGVEVLEFAEDEESEMRRWLAVCGCGWTGEAQDDKPDAEAEVARHREHCVTAATA